MPIKIMYPCQYPDCDARYDETLDGTTDDQPGILNGWVYPHDAEHVGDKPVPVHDHILNMMHKVEVEEEPCSGRAWPYTENNMCTLAARHKGNHKDRKGREFGHAGYFRDKDGNIK